MQFLHDYKVRQWLYGIATAVLVVLGGYGIFPAQEQENLTQLIVAILNLGGAGATILAGSNSRPSARDDEATKGKYGDYSDNQ